MPLGFDYKTDPWTLSAGQWRCWVCEDCRIVSYHHISYCPGCGRKMAYIRDRSSNLTQRFPTVLNGGAYRPYEWNPSCTDEQQPWRVAGYNDPPPIREGSAQQEHDTHAIGAFGP